jgi:hypothetical protein
MVGSLQLVTDGLNPVQTSAIGVDDEQRVLLSWPAEPGPQRSHQARKTLAPMLGGCASALGGRVFGRIGGVVEFRVLGPLEVRDGERIVPLGGAKQRAVLAILLLRHDEVVSRERLVDGVWGDSPPASAAHTLEVFIATGSRNAC